MKTDADVQSDVLEELLWEPSLNAANIGAAVKDGVVTLSGQVDNYLEKYNAEQATRRVAGVKAVVQDIVVELPGQNAHTDQDIAEAAVNALKWNSSVPLDAIRVKVENGVITLQGEVDWNYRKKAAEDSVHYLAGTKGVINLITLKPTLSFGAAEIKERIKKALERNANVEANAISVEAVNNEAILHGTVRSWSEYDAAESAAWAAPGVWHVNNNLNVLV
ncbi:BON domain-containing protein [Spirosoma spitsbergense]|uniref:BON domain-containing protein n=1 Tax=Spirosoma spitsbergense TaxID=431554 RepID=UPI00037FF9BD|nr:BON domain-containing protein [Spirosoma spitsbergense]